MTGTTSNHEWGEDSLSQFYERRMKEARETALEEAARYFEQWPDSTEEVKPAREWTDENGELDWTPEYKLTRHKLFTPSKIAAAIRALSTGLPSAKG